MSRRLTGEDAAMLGIWWFLSGGWIDGIPRSNATWTRRATRVVPDEETGKVPGAWHQLARLERMAIRWVGMAITAGLAVSYSARPDETVTALAWTSWTLALIGLTVAGYVAMGSLLLWGHRREVVWPLHTALHRHLGYSERYHPRHYLHVPPDGGSILVTLPADWTSGIDPEGGRWSSGVDVVTGELASGGNAKVVTTVLREKLGLSDYHYVWHLKGTDHYLEILPVPQPPKKVLVPANEAIQDLLLSLDEDMPAVAFAALPLGDKSNMPAKWLKAGCMPVSMEMRTESPNALCVGAPGSGKTGAAAAVAVQVLRNGGIVVIIDLKEFSLKALQGLPNVIYLSEIPDIHTGLLALSREVHRRKRLLRDWNEDTSGRPDVGPRILLITDEQNVLAGKLKKYWKKIKDDGDDKDSPAEEALDELHFMGRGLKFNLWTNAQSATTRALGGGPERRECYQGLALFGRVSLNQIRMIAPEVPTRRRRRRRHPGRMEAVKDNQILDVQVPWWDDPDDGKSTNLLRQWALGGVVTDAHTVLFGDGPIEARPIPAGELPAGAPAAELTPSQETGTVSHVETDAVTVTGRHLSVVPSDPDQGEQADRLVSLKQAVDEGIVRHTLVSIRKARYRYDDFPEVAKTGARDEQFFSSNRLADWDMRHPPEETGETA